VLRKSCGFATPSSFLRLYEEPVQEKPPERITVRQPLPSKYMEGDTVKIIDRKHKFFMKNVLVTYASGELVFVRHLAHNFHLRVDDVCIVHRRTTT
jgi:hypothetical protein